MKRLLIFLAIFPVTTFSQKNFTLSGKVTDIETGEDLIGASILATELVKGAITNSYGFYSLSLPEGTYTIHYRYIGYKETEQVLNLNKNHIINIELTPSALALDEVIVSSERLDLNLTSTALGVEKINLKKIKNIPVFFGEKDILKTIQLIPGVINSIEGNTGFNVRGGSMGQNLIILDDASIYSSSHIMGFFSVFNSDAIKDVTIYKGGIPAYYGGRVSSVLNITMNNGNSKTFSSAGGIGLLSTRLSFEGPIIKDKMSFIISGRRTYGDLIARLIFPDELVSNDVKFNFYDLNAKLNYTINDKNRLFLSGYFGNDIFEISDDLGTGWGNTTGTIRWNHLFSDKFFSKTCIIYSKYNYGFIFGLNSMRLKSGIADLSLKEDITWYINPDYTLKYGMNITYHEFRPGELTIGNSDNYVKISREKKAFESAVYIQNEHKITSRFSANYGLRFSAFSQIGPGWFYEYNTLNEPVDSTYYNTGKTAYPNLGFEPRIALNYKLSDKSSGKLSYNRMAQYLHLLSNNTTGSPTDVWMPSSNNLKPVFVDHFSAGFFRNFNDNSIETSIEAYYKNITNAADYEDGADIIFDEHIESQILKGKGRSYGLELYIKKKLGTLSGWISYSLSRTEKKIKGISNFSWYPVKYDKTHDICIVGIYKISQRLAISGVWIYTTGNAVTFPSGKYILDNNTVPYYTERNGYRMPDYHRLDVSLALDGKKRKKYKAGWEFSVYNLYNRYNAYMITFRESETIPGNTEAVKLSLFGIVPAITYKFKF
jgi:hypothetical protein